MSRTAWALLLLVHGLLLSSAASAQNPGALPPGAGEFLYGTALIRGESKGRAMEKDPEKGREYLLKSAQQGFPHAPFALCVDLRSGDPDAASLTLAHEWCSVAANIPGKTQVLAQKAVADLERALTMSAPARIPTLRASATSAVERFCKVNRERQPHEGCTPSH